jgi:hypothetical protein
MRWAALTFAVALGASGGLRIETGDVPGSDGRWQEARAVVDAPIDEVRGWLTDFARWPDRFDDVTSAEVLARPAPGRATIRFYSRIIGREMTMNVVWNRQYILYRGRGKNVDAQGRLHLVPLGRDRTAVIMQSSSDVHGLIGVLATQGMKRDRAFKKMRSDLAALDRLAGGTRM